MARSKGRQSAEPIERDLPHFVDIAVPPRGLADKLNAMYDFHTRHSVVPKRGRLARLRDGSSVIRWYFADPALAAAFAKKFAPN